MKEQEYQIYKEGEYTYPASFGFTPFLHAYLHDDDEIRPVMIIAPGGGYRFVSPFEGEIVARTFFEKDWNCFVLTYSVNTLDLAPLNKQPLMDISRAVRFVRKHAMEFHIDPEKLSVCGFSAAGHLCASLSVHYQDIADPDPALDAISNRPQAAILSYSVITSGEYAHRDSFTALLGADASEEMLDYMSLETQVTENTVPCFLWATATDDLVPVENSYLFSSALKKAKVPYTLHVFTDGNHGLSVATRDWADNKYAPNYTLRQTFSLSQAIKEGKLPAPSGEQGMFLQFITGIAGGENSSMPEEYKSQPNPEAAVWPDLADQWLKKVFSKKS